jgi:hypothetical protein
LLALEVLLLIGSACKQKVLTSIPPHFHLVLTKQILLATTAVANSFPKTLTDAKPSQPAKILHLPSPSAFFRSLNTHFRKSKALVLKVFIRAVFLAIRVFIKLFE